MKLWCQIYIRQAEDGETSDIHDWTCIHDTRKTDNKLIDPKCVIEKNKISTLTFRCRPNSPAYTLLRPENATKCEVWVCERMIASSAPSYVGNREPVHKWYEEEQITGGHVYRYDLFVGHATDYTPYFADNGLLEASITCVDHMDYLNNSIVPRQTYNLNEEAPHIGEKGAINWYRSFIWESNYEREQIHNTFARDEFDAQDNRTTNPSPSYEYVVDFEVLYSMLYERFIDRFGGVLYTDYTEYVIVGQVPAGETEKDPDQYPDGTTIRWISDSVYGRHRNVVIQNGVNLKSLRLETDREGFCTRLYPVGELKENGKRVSLKGYSGTQEKPHDPNTEYIEVDAQYISEYGVISKTQEWTDISQQSNLYSKAWEYLESNECKIKESFTISVLDLSVINNPEDRFRCGDYHTVIESDMSINEELQIIRIEYDLAQLQNVNLVMGDKMLSASEMQVRQATRNKEKFGEITSLIGGGN